MKALIMIRLIHAMIVVLYLLSIPCLAVLCPWYISIPLIGVMASNAAPDSNTCVLTMVENQYRDVLGLPRIESFIGSVIKSKLRIE